jgi:Flp pilus assembly protein TadB
MSSPDQRLSRPLYEGLPWMYVAGGAAALIVSYVSPYRVLGLIVGVLGFLGVLGGFVVLLRRRDYRAMRSQYGNSDSSLTDLGEK